MTQGAAGPVGAGLPHPLLSDRGHRQVTDRRFGVRSVPFAMQTRQVFWTSACRPGFLRTQGATGFAASGDIAMTGHQTSHGRMSVSDAVAELASLLLADHSFDAVLDRTADIAKRVVAGADEVSVTVQNGRPTTAAFTGQLALDVDESQYQAGYGPCLDAIRLGQTILVEDQTTEPRWPEYTPRAAEAGIRSSLSVPLSVDDRHGGAFNIYSLQTHTFDAVAVDHAQELAAYTAVVLNNAHLYFTAASRADQLTEALRSRAVIEQAKGILMGARHCNADEAFTILVKLSQDTHVKLHAVAQTVVDSALNDE
jgi:transcriptional regulator with GAF, ATPase, and Fis domain